MPSTTRRSFLAGLGGAALASTIPRTLCAAPMYPPTDLSYFETPISPAPFEFHFAYHAITWQGDDLQAIKDISELGFPGIQLRANVVKDYAGRADALKSLLAQHRLQFVALSSGNVTIAAATETEQIKRHVDNATFLRDAGGRYLQITDSRPRDRKPTADDYKFLGRALTEIGKRSADLGIVTAYHNHMGSLGEAPDEVDRVLEAADQRYVKFLLDMAHYQQGGGDPVAAIRKHQNRLALLHVKDLESPLPGGAARSYRFVELGNGRIDLPGVFAALRAVNYRGWGVIELDGVPDKSRTPRECAVISKRYVETKLKMKV